MSDMESTMVLDCVNPFDVNPIGGVAMAEEAAPKPPPTVVPGKNVKLEMEEFGDLAPYLPKGASNKTMFSSTDELNTPIFERKGPFDFLVTEEQQTYNGDPSASASSSDTNQHQFQFEYDSLSPEAALMSPPGAFNYNTNPKDIIIDNSDVMVVNAEALIFSPEQGEVYTFTNNKHNSANETPVTTYNNNIATYKIEDCSVTSVSDSNSPRTYDDHHNNLGLVTPEDSNSSDMTNDERNRLTLSLITSSIFNQPTAAINTPDVLDNVVALEASFNILDYVNAKDVTTVNIEDIRFDLPSTSSHQEEFAPQSPPHSAFSKGRKRKVKSYDDDEDYVPPSEKRARLVAADDSDAESEISVTTAPRRIKNRANRRTSSISSEQSDASKYRELRDKNNEASRKSRLKRKIKEQTEAKESEELREKNIKLKARVEELEKIVDKFRNNLFQIMLKK